LKKKLLDTGVNMCIIRLTRSEKVMIVIWTYR